MSEYDRAGTETFKFIPQLCECKPFPLWLLGKVTEVSTILDCCIIEQMPDADCMLTLKENYNYYRGIKNWSK